MQGDFRKFSAIQYYLGQSRNTVHVLFELAAPVSETAFHGLVSDVIARAPQLLWRESLQDGGHYRDTAVDWRKQCVSRAYTSAQKADADMVALMDKPLHDTGQPAFRAIFQNITDTQNPRSRIIFQTTHALMEGGDVADLLRGRASRQAARPVAEAGLSIWSRAGVWALIPLIWAINMVMALSERKCREDFGFARIALDREDLRRVAKTFGVSQRDLAFALTTHHRHTGESDKKLFIAYTTLPSVRVHLCDDEVLNVRVDDLYVPLKRRFEDYLASLSAALLKRGDTAMFAQTWHRRLCQVHQALHPRLPRLYPTHFFGFAPYDVVLSMLPPVKTHRYSAVLAGAEVYAGSDTGTAETCVFVPSGSKVTMSYWGGPDRDEKMRAIAETAHSLGIGVTNLLQGSEREAAE